MDGVAYHDAIDFAALPIGTLLEGVPVSHPVFEESWAYIEARRQKPGRVARLEEMRGEWERHAGEPAWYCARCRRIEDGSHRLSLHQEAGTGIPVEVKPVCFDLRKASVRMAHARAAVLAHSRTKKKDLEWLWACKEKKWRRLGAHVALLGRSVLDVGANSGWTLVESFARGARVAHGVEIREDMRAAAGQFFSAVRADGVCRVRWNDWTTARPKAHDVVFYMGLAHYFTGPDYERLLRKAADLAIETLVLELRICAFSLKGTALRGGQTLVTPGHLHSLLESYGFRVRLEGAFDDGRRGLFVADRVQ